MLSLSKRLKSSGFWTGAMICCFTPADGIAEITAAPVRSAFAPPLLWLRAGRSDSAYRHRLRGVELAGLREGRLCVALKSQVSLQARATISLNEQVQRAWLQLLPSMTVDKVRSTIQAEDEPCSFGCLVWDGMEEDFREVMKESEQAATNRHVPVSNMVHVEDTAILIRIVLAAALQGMVGLLDDFASTYEDVVVAALPAAVPPEQLTTKSTTIARDKVQHEVCAAEALAYKLEGLVVGKLDKWHVLLPAFEPPTRPKAQTHHEDIQSDEGESISDIASKQATETYLRETAWKTNKMLVDRVLRAEKEANWKFLHEKDGVRVWSSFLGEEFMGGWPHGLGPQSKSGDKFQAILARGVVDASPEQVFSMFDKNELVSEYNEYCNEIEDVVVLDRHTKITWGASKPMGPFSSRDFVTRCYIGQNNNGDWIAANLAESLPCNKQRAEGKSLSYVRMEILLGGTIGRPVEGGKKTEYTILCHTNPGGAADSTIGAHIMNKIAASGPVVHIKAIRDMVARRSDPARERVSSIAKAV